MSYKSWAVSLLFFALGAFACYLCDNFRKAYRATRYSLYYTKELRLFVDQQYRPIKLLCDIRNATDDSIVQKVECFWRWTGNPYAEVEITRCIYERGGMVNFSGESRKILFAYNERLPSGYIKTADLIGPRDERVTPTH